MVVKRMWWRKASGSRTWPVEGWFLFGVIPLYVRDVEYRPGIELVGPDNRG